MKTWAKVLKVLGYIWCILAIAIILVGTIGVLMSEGFSGIQRLLSPFNVINYIVMFIIILPGIGAIIWADKIKEKTSSYM